jgi:YfiH family protein
LSGIARINLPPSEHFVNGASFHLGADGIYRCGEFQHFLWQSHGFGTRKANPEVDVTLRQIHSAMVWNAHPLMDRQHEGDALITDDVHRRIGVRTADCVPILLLDAGNHAVAAVHAGWRGTAAGIVVRAIEKMHSDFGTQSSDIHAAIGPCIRACCYQVGPEVAAQFSPMFPEWPPVTGKQNLDLVEANRRYLAAAGIEAGRVFDSGLCTVCLQEHFFSYRREPQNPGRMLSVICRLD